MDDEVQLNEAEERILHLESKLARAEKLIRAIERDAENATEYVLCQMYAERGKVLEEVREAVKRIDKIAGEWLDAPISSSSTDELFDANRHISDVICEVASAPLSGFIAGTWPDPSALTSTKDLRNHVTTMLEDKGLVRKNIGELNDIDILCLLKVALPDSDDLFCER